MSSQWTRRRLLGVGGAVVLASLAGCASSQSPSSQSSSSSVAGAVSLLSGSTIVTSTSCPCCHRYADVLGENGVDGLAIDEREDYTAPKEEAGIPRDYWSCHTVLAGDYVIEGHVPLAAVEKLADERPDVVGIALPGMPAGSPGMGGQKDGEFVVYAVERDGSTREFARV